MRDVDLTTSGIYTVTEASKLLGISPARIRGWLRGYKGTQVGPLIESNEIDRLNGKYALTFGALMEARFVSVFVNMGLHVKTVRWLAVEAKKLIESEHPFAMYNFKTDGKSIYSEVLENHGAPRLYNLRTNNWMFHDIMIEQLHHGVTFDGATPVEWVPDPRRKSVVLNPVFSFGQPVVASKHVPTRALYDAYRAENSYEVVADWFDVPISDVKEAVGFEVGYLSAA